MKKITAIRFNDQPIHVFDYITYIYDNEDDINFTFNLELIISEVTALKYEREEEISVTIEYDNLEKRTLTMEIESITEVGNAEIPEISLTTSISSPNEFPGVQIINWDTEEWPKLTKDITIEEIRAVEMPSREVEITATLPIDLAEWLEWNDHDEEILKQVLYEYKAKASK